MISNQPSLINDVTQSKNLNDGYVIAGALAVADRGLIDEALLISKINKAGIYGYYAYVRGIPTVVTVDESLPYESIKSKNLFSTGSND